MSRVYYVYEIIWNGRRWAVITDFLTGLLETALKYFRINSASILYGFILTIKVLLVIILGKTNISHFVIPCIPGYAIT